MNGSVDVPPPLPQSHARGWAALSFASLGMAVAAAWVVVLGEAALVDFSTLFFSGRERVTQLLYQQLPLNAALSGAIWICALAALVLASCTTAKHTRPGVVARVASAWLLLQWSAAGLCFGISFGVFYFNS